MIGGRWPRSKRRKRSRSAAQEIKSPVVCGVRVMSVVHLHGKAPGRAPLAHEGRGGRGARYRVDQDLLPHRRSAVRQSIESERRAGRNGSAQFWASATSLSRGVRGGAIVNVDEAERAIRVAVDAAERMAQRTISEVFVNVSGGRPQSRFTPAKIKRRPAGVAARSRQCCSTTAWPRSIPAGARCCIWRPIHYHLDDARGRQGTRSACLARRSGVDLDVVTVEPSHLHNLSLAVARAHLTIAGFRDGALCGGEVGARRRRAVARHHAHRHGRRHHQFRDLPGRPSGPCRCHSARRPAYHQRHRARPFHHHCPCRTHEDLVGLALPRRSTSAK